MDGFREQGTGKIRLLFACFESLDDTSPQCVGGVGVPNGNWEETADV